MTTEPVSNYLLQIIDRNTGEVVYSWLPGMALETKLIEELASRVEAKGVGLGRTSAHVKKDVISAFKEMLFEMKNRVNPL